MRPGFIILEILLASALAAFIALALFSGFGQLNSSVKNIENSITIHMDAALVMRQLQRDISGIHIPFMPSRKKEKEQKGDEETDYQTDKILYATMRDGTIELFTCITHNTQQEYWSGTVGHAKPRIARIVYRLVSDTRDSDRTKSSYVLLRQESGNLMFSAFEPSQGGAVRSYEVIRGIKSMRMQFYRQTKDDEEPRLVDTWGIDEEEVQLPVAIQIYIELWYPRKKRYASYTWIVPVIAQEVEEEGNIQEGEQQKKMESSEQKENKAESDPKKSTKPGIKGGMDTLKNLLGGFDS